MPRVNSYTDEQIPWIELMTVPERRRALYRAPKARPLDLLMHSDCPSACVFALATAMGVSCKELAKWLGLADGAVCQASEEVLSRRDAEAVLGLAMLVGQVDDLVVDWCTAASFFSSGTWLRHWLRRPKKALGKMQMPWRLLCLASGREALSVALATERIPDNSVHPRAPGCGHGIHVLGSTSGIQARLL